MDADRGAGERKLHVTKWKVGALLCLETFLLRFSHNKWTHIPNSSCKVLACLSEFERRGAKEGLVGQVVIDEF